MPDFHDILGLESFGPLDHLKLHHLIFLERLEPLPLDGAMMYENISAVILGDESITLGIIKPLDLPLHFHAYAILLKIGTMPRAA